MSAEDVEVVQQCVRILSFLLGGLGWNGVGMGLEGERMGLRERGDV